MGSNKKRQRNHDYDVIIIGSGAGGGVAAHILNSAGKKVAIVEHEHIGGECPNWGCVPTKALLQSAETYHSAKNADQFGVKVSKASVDLSKVKQWKDLAVKRTGTFLGDKAFTKDGIDVINGTAHFLDKHTINVGKQRYSAKNFVIASGAHNFIPPIEGLDRIGFITHREAGDQTKPIGSLLVIGGGPIGCEFSQYFSTIGTKVTIAEFAPRLIAREDPLAGQMLEEVFKAKGVNVLTGAQVLSVRKLKDKKVVTYLKDDKKHRISVDEILLAAGMRPNTDIGLENAGVDYDKRGIKAKPTMQTTANNIYTAGDVTGPYAFTHMASYQSRIAAHNILHRTKVVAKYHAVPRVVFTEPEIASVGISEEQAKDQGLKTKPATVPTSILGRANTTNQMTGYVKVITSHTGVLLGAVIMAPRAGEMIHELTLAVNLGLKADKVAETIHAFPTWSEAVRIACAKVIKN